MEQRIWTLSNALSAMRVVLVVPIAGLLLRHDPGDRVLAVGLMVISSMTDLLDGMVARKLKQVTELGKIIDPVADKISVGAVCVILAIQGAVPVWFLASLLVRDAAIFLGGAYVKRRRGILLQSNRAGKWAVAVVALFIVVGVADLQSLSWLRDVLLLASTVMLVISFVLYLRRFLSVISLNGAG